MFLDPAKHVKVDSHFAGNRLVGEHEVELELEHVADVLTVSTNERIVSFPSFKSCQCLLYQKLSFPLVSKVVSFSCVKSC